MVIYLKNETFRYGSHDNLVSVSCSAAVTAFGLCIVSYSNLVWKFALITSNLAKQKLHIKYGFDKVTYQKSKACAF